MRQIYGNKIFNALLSWGGKTDVISVYDSSYYFQGFITQAYARLMEMDVEYFLFIADDLMIHPEIDEWNAAQKLGLSKEKEIFCFNLSELNQRESFEWTSMRGSSEPFVRPGMEWHNELPFKEDAFALFREFMGKEYPRVYNEEFFQECTYSEEEREAFYRSNGSTWEVPYPMARGYSDIFAVKKSSLGKVAHMFGIFAAMNMFVEIAMPTAMVLTVKRGNVSFVECSEFTSEMVLWKETEILNVEREYENNISNLLNRFPEGCLCIHPVKLSRWSV